MNSIIQNHFLDVGMPSAFWRLVERFCWRLINVSAVWHLCLQADSHKEIHVLWSRFSHGFLCCFAGDHFWGTSPFLFFANGIVRRSYVHGKELAGVNSPFTASQVSCSVLLVICRELAYHRQLSNGCCAWWSIASSSPVHLRHNCGRRALVRFFGDRGMLHA